MSTDFLKYPLCNQDRDVYFSAVPTPEWPQVVDERERLPRMPSSATEEADQTRGGSGSPEDAEDQETLEDR